MSPTPNTTSFAILGLLSLRDWTTYELAKQVQRSLNWFWPRAERKLYDEPKHLVTMGLATARKELTGRRARTVYTVTESGREALREWLSEPAAPRGGEFEAMLKVFFADAGDRDQLLATLRRIETEAESRLETLAQFAAGQAAFPRRTHLRAIGLAMQHEQEDAVRRWARWASDQAAEWPAADDPGGWDSSAILDRLARGESVVGGRR